MKISQREAHWLKKRVAVLEAAEDQRRSAWANEYPGGVYIGSISADAAELAKVEVARKLGHAVVCINANGVIRLYALLLGSKQ